MLKYLGIFFLMFLFLITLNFTFSYIKQVMAQARIHKYKIRIHKFDHEIDTQIPYFYNQVTNFTKAHYTQGFTLDIHAFIF